MFQSNMRLMLELCLGSLTRPSVLQIATLTLSVCPRLHVLSFMDTGAVYVFCPCWPCLLYSIATLICSTICTACSWHCGIFYHEVTLLDRHVALMFRALHWAVLGAQQTA